MALTPKKNNPITIKVDDATRKKIEDLTIKNNSTMSYEVRKMVDFYFESKEKMENK